MERPALVMDDLKSGSQRGRLGLISLTGGSCFGGSPIALRLGNLTRGLGTLDVRAVEGQLSTTADVQRFTSERQQPVLSRRSSRKGEWVLLALRGSSMANQLLSEALGYQLDVTRACTEGTVARTCLIEFDVESELGTEPERLFSSDRVRANDLERLERARSDGNLAVAFDLALHVVGDGPVRRMYSVFVAALPCLADNKRKVKAPLRLPTEKLFAVRRQDGDKGAGLGID